MAAGAPRDFKVAGGGLQIQGGDPSPNGCNVPVGLATAAVINFVAVNPVGPGNLRAWAYSTPPVGPPGASILNYATVPGLNIANGIVVPICDEALTNCNSLDLRVQADVSNTQLVADVVGYFERFPKEQVRSFSVLTSATGTPTVVGATCTHVTGMQVVVNAFVAGKVIVRANVSARIGHMATDEGMFAYIGTTATDCTGVPVVHSVHFALPNGSYNFVLPVVRSFDVAPGTYTYFVNALMVGGADANDLINDLGVYTAGSTVEATFIPN